MTTHTAATLLIVALLTTLAAVTAWCVVTGRVVPGSRGDGGGS